MSLNNLMLHELSKREGNLPLIKRIESQCEHIIKVSRDQYALQAAKDIVPIAELVQSNLDILDGDYQDNLLPVLVNWFSEEFFTWFTEPVCAKCNVQLVIIEVFVNLENKRVELYGCNTKGCDYTFDFIRHTDPAILLTTRTGRCGEWAECFMLVARALDYDVRFVSDNADHVWNEVWSEAQKRWLHVDSCENSVDFPLLYETGWSKKQTYCIAYSQYEVQDVTKRYSINYEETKSRRYECDEAWLAQYLDNLTNRMVKSYPPEIIDKVISRRIGDKENMRELASKPKHVESNQSQMRKTGSVAWRIQRGEYSPITKKFFIVKVGANQSVIDHEPLFYLGYSSLRNCYESSSSEYQRKSWSSLIHTSKNLDYKYERDWKTSYIARYETCSAEKEGELTWRFDLSDLGIWTKLEMRVDCKIYPNTSVDLSLICYGKGEGRESYTRELNCNELNTLTFDQLNNETSFDLVVKLSGGDTSDNVAWQKPQLFRQTRGENADEWPFIFKVF